MFCPACGRKLEIGVCSGPHPGYRLRFNGGTKLGIELPDWWPVHGMHLLPSTDPDERLGVTASGVTWRIRYDPRVRLRKERYEAERLEAERRREELREHELETLLRLADKLGFEVRERVVA